MKTAKVSVLVVVLLMLALPVLQLKLKLFTESPLGGYYTKIEKPSLKLFSCAGWFDGSFQDTLAFRINSHIGLRGPLIRVNNQCDYSLFGMIHADGFVRGKGGMLYEEDYIHEYTGNYFIGTAPIDKKLARLKNVMDSLKAHGVTLILVFEPGKASFYPEYIPDRYFDELPTNRQESGIVFRASGQKRPIALSANTVWGIGYWALGQTHKVTQSLLHSLTHSISQSVNQSISQSFFRHASPITRHDFPVTRHASPVTTFPSRVTRHPSLVTNYTHYLSRCLELGLPFIDLNQWFLQMKDTSRYPLFPRYGMHWSLYAVPLTVDTLVKAIEANTGAGLPGFCAWIAGEGKGIQMSKFKCQNSNVKTQNQSVNQSISQSIKYSFTHSEAPLGTDNDIGQLLNLVCAPKRTNEVYPVIAFDTAAPRTVDALVIADSYYVNIVDTFGQKLFRKQDYWYYNKKLYPYQNDNPPKYVDKSNLREKLLGYNVILLMVSEINLHCGFWNFADEAYLAFHPEERDTWIYDIENEIRNERSWFRFMVRKAGIQQRPLDELITADARYTYYSNIANYPPRNREDSIYRIALSIRNSPDWFEVVKKKAVERNIPIDSMVMIDAEYTWEEQRRIK
jgi:hypothetical protein